MTDCICLYYGEALGRYGFGNGHPFGPDRLDAFWKETCARGLNQRVTIMAPSMCDEDALRRFHSQHYIDRVKSLSRQGQGYLDQGDTPAYAGVYEDARVVTGSVLDAVDRVMSGECRRAFVPIAGLHHAQRDTAAGFCVFNDLAVAIETLKQQYGLKRIAYVDIDAHHGDGVFYGFESDPSVIFADIHEDGRYLYPGTGAAQETGTGNARGSKLNLPLPPDSGDDDFLHAWNRIEAHLDTFRCDFVILQAGADSVAGDPITHLGFSAAMHGHAARRLCRLADQYCSGRLLAVGGGGYNRANLATAWNNVLQALIDS